MTLDQARELAGHLQKAMPFLEVCRRFPEFVWFVPYAGTNLECHARPHPDPFPREPMTICWKCQYMRLMSDSCPVHECLHPDVERKATVHQVTGDPCFITRDGRRTKRRYPKCEDINSRGQCPYYQDRPNEEANDQ